MAVSANFASKQILPFGSAERYYWPIKYRTIVWKVKLNKSKYLGVLKQARQAYVIRGYGKGTTVSNSMRIFNYRLIRTRILVQVTTYRRFRIDRDGYLDQSELTRIRVQVIRSCFLRRLSMVLGRRYHKEISPYFSHCYLWIATYNA